MNFKAAICSGFNRWLDFSGRSSRSEFWYFAWLLPSLVTLSIATAQNVMEHYTGYIIGGLGWVLNFSIVLPFALAALSASIRRLHDVNKSGWLIFWVLIFSIVLPWALALLSASMRDVNQSGLLVLLMIIPNIGALILISIQIQKGTDGNNRYGADPLQTPHAKTASKPSFFTCFLILFLFGIAYGAFSIYKSDPQATIPKVVKEFFITKRKIVLINDKMTNEIRIAVFRNDNVSIINSINNGMDVNVRNERDGRTLLHYAASRGNLPLITFLLEKGMDVNIQDNDNSTALHYAAYTKGNIRTLDYLLSKGAKTDIVDKEKLTPLGYARLAQDPQMINALSKLEHGQ